MSDSQGVVVNDVDHTAEYALVLGEVQVSPRCQVDHGPLEHLDPGLGQPNSELAAWGSEPPCFFFLA